MATYVVKWDYRGKPGPYVKGEVVELTEEQAEWLNRDSPGVVELTEKVLAEPNKALKAAKDRMVKAAENRGHGGGEAMSKKDFKAVKEG